LGADVRFKGASCLARTMLLSRGRRYPLATVLCGELLRAITPIVDTAVGSRAQDTRCSGGEWDHRRGLLMLKRNHGTRIVSGTKRLLLLHVLCMFLWRRSK
jgi:hypothetical protein